MPCYCAYMSTGKCAHCRAVETRIYEYRDGAALLTALSWLHQPWVKGGPCPIVPGARQYAALGRAKRRAFSLAARVGQAITIDGVRHVA